MANAELAYRYVAIAAMLVELNRCAEVLELPIHLPVEVRDLRGVYVPNPRILGQVVVLRTEEYNFSAMGGQMQFVTCLVNEQGPLSLREYQTKMSKVPSNLSTNEAYGLAKKLLASLEVDVDRLEREKAPTTDRQGQWEPGPNGSSVWAPLPWFETHWGARLEPAVRVSVSGTNGMLLFLRQEDISYSRRPADLVTNLESLLRISDAEFRAMPVPLRSNLISEFAFAAHRNPAAFPPRAQVPLAFRCVAEAVMLAEVNDCAKKLGLPIKLPLTEAQLTQTYLVPPALTRFGGHLDTTNYSFVFDSHERLCSIKKLDPYGGLTYLQATAKLKGVKSKIGKDGAHRLARKWLELLSVDLPELEKTEHGLSHQQVWLNPTPGMPVKVPIFDVVWGHLIDPMVTVWIDGRTKELIELTVWRESLLRRPAPLIRDREELLKVSDSEFSSYSKVESEELVTKFSARSTASQSK